MFSLLGIEYHENGQIRYKGEYVNNYLTGHGNYDKGTIVWFINGFYTFLGIEYKDTGKKKYEGEYKGGEKHGKGKKLRNYFEDKDIFINCSQFFWFSKGIEYDENEVKCFEGEFKEGKYWNGKGKFTR